MYQELKRTSTRCRRNRRRGFVNSEMSLRARAIRASPRISYCLLNFDNCRLNILIALPRVIKMRNP